MSHSDDITKLIFANNRRLQKLKEQKALQGSSADPKIIIEIEDIEAEIEKLQAELNEDTKDEERLRLTVHRAFFVRTGIQCYFINVTNLFEKEIEVTHVWFECNPQIHALQPDRPLPKRLKPAETWETWIEVYKLPDWVHKDPYNLARARLSTGVIVESQKNENVPEEGFVPGGSDNK